MATRGHLGGLAVAAPQALRVFDAAGCDTVLVETVGVGSPRWRSPRAADMTLVLLAPGMGDGIQAAKAGILEIGDIFVVNKADRDGAQAVVRELRGMIALAPRAAEDWKPPVIVPPWPWTARASRSCWRRSTGSEHARALPALLARRRLDRARREVEAWPWPGCAPRCDPWSRGGWRRGRRRPRRPLDPYAAADRLLGGDSV